MSDDYTPSTSTVRQAWHEAPYNGGGGREMSDAEFDRWLESVRAEERERIAQAIIERTSGYYSMSGPPEDRTRYYLGINHAVRIVREGA